MSKSALGVRRSASLKAVEALGLPTPRLQIRWEPAPPRTAEEKRERMRALRAFGIKQPPPEFRWKWHYELVIGLGTNDIRNPHECERPGELTLALGGGLRTGGRPEPVFEGQVDVPYRDSAHAVWDGLQLGRPPLYAICGNSFSLIQIDWQKKADERSRSW